jgi:uncharacterized protein YndB with AHSA1/START domain
MFRPALDDPGYSADGAGGRRLMSEVHEQTLIDAPVAAVWALVGDPSRYPEWLPRVLEVQGERFEEGLQFMQVSHHPVIGRDEIHFLIDRKDDLREIRMHCLSSGMFVHWQLTEARDATFVNAVFGMEPIRRRDRLIDLTVGRRFFRGWLSEAMESLKSSASRVSA